MARTHYIRSSSALATQLSALTGRPVINREVPSIVLPLSKHERFAAAVERFNAA